MTISIDTEPIDFTIENENTVGEVVEELSRFLEGHRLKIVEIHIDDERVAEPQPDKTEADWHSRALDSVTHLSVRTVPDTDAPIHPSADSPARDRRIERLETVNEYLLLFRQALEQEEETALHDLASEYPHVAPALPELIAIELPAGGASSLDTLAERFCYGTAAERVEIKPAFTELLERLSVIARSRLQEQLTPHQEAVAARELLREHLPRLSDVSLLLQSGKDAEGMAHVAQFTEIAGKLIRLLPMVEPFWKSDELHEFAKSYHAQIAELMDAFASRDSVLIGDLLEYEITPASLELIQRLDALEPVSQTDSGIHGR